MFFFLNRCNLTHCGCLHTDMDYTRLIKSCAKPFEKVRTLQWEAIFSLVFNWPYFPPKKDNDLCKRYLSLVLVFIYIIIGVAPKWNKKTFMEHYASKVGGKKSKLKQAGSTGHQQIPLDVRTERLTPNLFWMIPSQKDYWWWERGMITIEVKMKRIIINTNHPNQLQIQMNPRGPILVDHWDSTAFVFVLICVFFTYTLLCDWLEQQCFIFLPSSYLVHVYTFQWCAADI